MPKIIFLSVAVILTALFIRCHFKENSRFLIAVFIAALTIRIICATFIFLFSLHQGNAGFFSGDESVYYKKAVNMALSENIHGKNIFKETPELDSPLFAINLFTILESVLISAFGQSLLFIKYFNSFLGALLTIIIFLLAKVLTDNVRIAKISSLLAAFFPSIVTWSSVGIKEPLIMLVIAYIYYFYLKSQGKFNFLYMVNIVILSATLFYLQTNAAVIIMIIFGLWFIFVGLSKFIKKEMLALIFILIGSYTFLSNQKSIGKKLYDIASYQTVQYRAGNFNSSRYLLYPYGEFRWNLFYFPHHFKMPKSFVYDYNTDIVHIKNNIIAIKWASFFISYCKGLSYVLFSPFLWRVNSFPQLMAYPQAVLWWMMVPCIIYGMAWSLRYKRKETILIIFFIWALYSVLALTEGNVGALLRHKDWVTPFCLIFAAMGINRIIFGSTLSARRPG